MTIFSRLFPFAFPPFGAKTLMEVLDPSVVAEDDPPPAYVIAPVFDFLVTAH